MVVTTDASVGSGCNGIRYDTNVYVCVCNSRKHYLYRKAKTMETSGERDRDQPVCVTDAHRRICGGGPRAVPLPRQ
jgi:hypothetical protein